MRIIPAIDIIDGKCVRLSQGDYNTKKIYNGSPLEVAKSYEDAGIKYLHLVDLDGAKARHIVNNKVLEDICSKTSLKVDFGGGIKSNEDIEIAFSGGAKQITAGSIAVRNPGIVESWIQKYGADKIILGADVKGRNIAINGWKDDTTENIFDFVQKYSELGIESVISTDIATDGMLSGPSYGLYTDLVDRFHDLKVIASGGVSALSDLDQLTEIGVEGVIIGKAIYENKFTLKELEKYVAKRIVPCLDIKDGRTVKGINFVGLRDAGDPVELAKRYSVEGADELVLLDISATAEKRKTLVETVKRVAQEVNIPFTVGGGISSIEDVDMILQAGADKVSINSAAVKDPDLINRLSSKFGSQCITLAIDAKNVDGKWIVHLVGGKVQTDLDLFDWAVEGTRRGAGEILFTSMDNDGTKNGFANEALSQLKKVVNVPIIASGGAGSIKDFEEVFSNGNADAALAASVFHYKEIDIIELKKELDKKGIEVRL